MSITFPAKHRRDRQAPVTTGLIAAIFGLHVCERTMSSGAETALDNRGEDAVGAAAGARERILRATLALIAEAGVAAVTNRRVARAAGVSLDSPG